MLIINADDLGKDHETSDNIMDCFCKGLITSASAMVFMTDSQRAAESAKEAGLETGLHINFTEPFDGSELPSGLKDAQQHLAGYFCKSKWTRLLYNPFLQNKVDYVFRAQLDEYRKSFSEEPSHFNGHHHMHLCMNMIIKPTIPFGSSVRRDFSFERAEKNSLNRFYRRSVDNRLAKRYCCTDHFFSLEQSFDSRRLKRIVSLGSNSDVEIAVHPGKAQTLSYLKSPQYQDLIFDIPKGTYRSLKCNQRISAV